MFTENLRVTAMFRAMFPRPRNPVPPSTVSPMAGRAGFLRRAEERRAIEAIGRGTVFRGATNNARKIAVLDALPFSHGGLDI